MDSWRYDTPTIHSKWSLPEHHVRTTPKVKALIVLQVLSMSHTPKQIVTLSTKDSCLHCDTLSLLQYITAPHRKANTYDVTRYNNGRLLSRRRQTTTHQNKNTTTVAYLKDAIVTTSLHHRTLPRLYLVTTCTRGTQHTSIK